MNPELANGSKPQSTPMSRQARARVFKYPCDGVKRFGVKGDKSDAREEGQTYSEAHDMIFFATGGSMDEKQARTFSKEGVRRISLLNMRYIALAGPFIQKWFADQRQKAADAAVKGTPPVDQTPKPEEPAP